MKSSEIDEAIEGCLLFGERVVARYKLKVMIDERHAAQEIAKLHFKLYNEIRERAAAAIMKFRGEGWAGMMNSRIVQALYEVLGPCGPPSDTSHDWYAESIDSNRLYPVGTRVVQTSWRCKRCPMHKVTQVDEALSDLFPKGSPAGQVARGRDRRMQITHQYCTSAGVWRWNDGYGYDREHRHGKDRRAMMNPRKA